VRAEVAAGIDLRLAVDSDSLRRKDGRGVKERSMMLAAVETVTDADTVRLT
jgi:hypothetical protein